MTESDTSSISDDIDSLELKNIKSYKEVKFTIKEKFYLKRIDHFFKHTKTVDG
jgi:hypothetical protein